MSAKDRLAAFQNKAESSTVKKTTPGPRKIGKLNIPGQEPGKKEPAKKEPAKPAPKNKVVKKKKEPEMKEKPEPKEQNKAEPAPKAEPKEQNKAEPAPKAGPKEQNKAEPAPNAEPKEQNKAEPAPKAAPTVESELKAEPKAKHTPTIEPKAASKLQAKKPPKTIQAEKKAESEKEEPKKPTVPAGDVSKKLKETDLDLTVEIQANIDLASLEKQEIKLAKSTDTEILPELNPTPSKPVEAKTTVVAGITQGGSAPGGSAIGGSAPADKPLEPQPAKHVEATTTTVAGIAPAGATLTPKAAPAVEGKPTTVAGIPPPGAIAVQSTEKHKSLQPEAETMVVAGIWPAGKQPQAKTAEQQEAVKTPEAHKSIKPVKAQTTTVAGIAPQGANEITPQQPSQAQATPTEPEKPKEIRKRPPQLPTKKLFQPIPEEFFDNIFYFSGMGTVVGSALSKGVYVPKRSTTTALDIEVIECYEAKKDDEIAQGVRVVKRARTEAEELAEELRKLQALLSGLPTFGTESSQSQPTMARSQAQFPNGQSRSDVPGLDMIAKKVEVVAKDIAVAPQMPPPAPRMPQRHPVLQMPPVVPIMPTHVPQMPPSDPEPITSAFTPVVHAPPPRAPVEHRVPPITSQGSNVGVFKGMANGPGPSTHQSWQERYAGKPVTDAQAPKPFGGGDIPSGLKPWELSRLRGLEARGFEFTHEQPQSGADYSDDFYHGGSQMTGSDAKDDDIASYAPYLVSNRSKKRDRAQMLHHEAVSGGAFSPPHMVGLQPHMVASPITVAPLPYSDL